MNPSFLLYCQTETDFQHTQVCLILLFLETNISSKWEKLIQTKYQAQQKTLILIGWKNSPLPERQYLIDFFKRNIRVFKTVVYQWLPFGTNFPKRYSILSYQERRNIFIRFNFLLSEWKASTELAKQSEIFPVYAPLLKRGVR